MKQTPVMLMLAIVVCLTVTASRGTLAQDARRPEVRFVSTTKAGTMEKELNELAAKGFRVERISKSTFSGNLAALVVSSDKSSPATRYEYKLLATRRAETMEKEIMEAAGQGYEMRGLISLMRPGFAAFIGDETTALMERPFGESAMRYEYKILSSTRDKGMQADLNDAVSAGFTPIEVLLSQDARRGVSVLLGPKFAVTAILGRQANNASPARGREYKFLGTSKVSTMEREMNEQAKDGYRLYFCASTLVALMYKDEGVSGPVPYQYKLLATRKTGTMQKELSEHGLKGYKYLATTSGLGGLTAVLERDLRPEEKESRREYKLIATRRENTTQNELVEALAAGYQLLDLTTVGEFIAVLDRKTEDQPAKANAKAAR